MKRSHLLAVLIIAMIISSSVFAQNLSIQGVARDNTGQSLPYGIYGFEFRLYTVETNGNPVWSEIQNLEVKNGTFSAILGESTSMAGIDFDAEYWLGISIDGNSELAPRTKLILSPYAIMAQQDNQDNVFPLSGPVGIGTSNPQYGLEVHGKIRQDLDNENDVWIQGGSAISGGDRNLAMVGFKNLDRLVLNYGGEYSQGTVFNGNVGVGIVPEANFHVLGAVQFSNASIPIGITNQLGGTTPLMNFDANFLHATRNTSYRGGAFRIDTRGDDYPLFQWLSRAAGSTDIPVRMSLTEAGDLTVKGNVNLGNSGEYGAVAAEAGQTKIIYGWVAADGTIEMGTGFSVSRLGTGHYRIDFTHHFSGTPAATFTVLGGGVSRDNTFYIPYLTSSQVQVVSHEAGLDSGEDTRFTFIVVGPR